MNHKLFISHNSRDKPVVEPIAIKLSEIFGSDNVFYDSWSIKPGDSIPGRMSASLEEFDLFFLFWSKNSAISKMVEKEWESAFMREVLEGKRIVVVKLDDTPIPQLLSSKKYLSLYTSTQEIIIRQLIDIINGGPGFIQSSGESNYSVHLTEESDGVLIRIEVKYYMEPSSRYFINLDNEKGDVTLKAFVPECIQGFNSVKMNENIAFHGFYYAVSEATMVGFPIKIKILSINGKKVEVCSVYHQITEKDWSPIYFRRAITVDELDKHRRA